LPHRARCRWTRASPQLSADLAAFDPDEDLDGLAERMLAHADSIDNTALVVLRSLHH
jgi:hypothetical protein